MILEMLSTLAAGLFAGAALYINLVEHPARIECGTVLAVTEFAPSYRRAAIMQGVLAALGFLIATSAWLTGASLWWLIGGIILGQLFHLPSLSFFRQINSYWIIPWIRSLLTQGNYLFGGEDCMLREAF